MYKQVLALAIAFSPGLAPAHNSTDWRKDKKAYASVREFSLQNSEVTPLTVQLPVISSDFLKTKLSELTSLGNRGERAGRTSALKWLEKEYQALGFTTSTQAFNGGANFIAERPGKDPSRVFILSSHIDSVNNQGANDDGSGTVGVLAIAQALKDFNLKYTLRIVGFDREEVGLVGSSYYVENLKDRAAVLGNIQMEMMATNSRRDGRFHVVDCGRRDSIFMTKAIVNASVNLNLGLTNISACTEASDHASFWEYNVPAVATSENFFGGDGDSCYHRKCDVIDGRIDWEYMRKVTSAIGQATAEIMGAVPR